MQYRVLADESRHSHELTVKHSKFIAVLQRVAEEAEVAELLIGLRREFRDARHFCTAYLLGPAREIQRSNDDGEPAGTAGAPMLEVLRQRPEPTGQAGLSDVCAVVIRYFGGTLLGTGGLIRAYSEAVSGVLDQTPTVRRRQFAVHRLVVPHAVAGRYQNELGRAGGVLGKTDYGDQATLEIAVEADGPAAQRLQQTIAAIDRTVGLESHLQPAGNRWIDG